MCLTLAHMHTAEPTQSKLHRVYRHGQHMNTCILSAITLALRGMYHVFNGLTRRWHTHSHPHFCSHSCSHSHSRSRSRSGLLPLALLSLAPLWPGPTCACPCSHPHFQPHSCHYPSLLLPLIVMFLLLPLARNPLPPPTPPTPPPPHTPTPHPTPTLFLAKY